MSDLLQQTEDASGAFRICGSHSGSRTSCHQILPIAVLGLVLCLSAELLAQEAVQQSSTEKPTQLVSLNLEYIFNHLHKYQFKKQSLEEQSKQFLAKQEVLEQRIEFLKSGFAEGNLPLTSPEFTETQRQVAEAQAELQKFRNSFRRDQARQNKQVRQEFQTDVNDVLSKYAEYYKLCLVVRTDCTDSDIKDEHGVSQNVELPLWKCEDSSRIVLTEVVTNVLNRQWEQEGNKVPEISTAAHDSTKTFRFGGIEFTR